MYKFKIIRVADNREWQPPADNPNAGAGPQVEGAWLAKKVTVEITPRGAHGRRPEHAQGRPFKITGPEIYELLVPCSVGDVTEQEIKKAVRDRISRLPYKHTLEDREIEVE